MEGVETIRLAILVSSGFITSSRSSTNLTSHPEGIERENVPFPPPLLLPPVLFPPVLLPPVLFPPVLLPPVLLPDVLFPEVLLPLELLFPPLVQFDQNATKSGVWSTDNKIVSSTFPSLVTYIDRFMSSPGATFTSPLSPA